MSYRVQSVERSVDVLRALAAGPQTVTEVARTTSLAKPTAFRILASLAHGQFVVRESGAGHRYILGPGLLPLLQEIATTLGWVGALGGDVLRKLWERTGETITIHVRIAMERICVEELPSSQPIRYTASVGAAEPIHVGSAGKVLLGFMPPEQLEKLLPTLRLTPVTERSITSKQELLRELERTRANGWATSAGERIHGAAALSVPVRAPGSTVLALSVLGPASRFTPEKQEEYIPLALRAATALETVLGATR